ncbi:Carbohydrate binding family 6 [Anaeromyxobacter sp. Fw109-5]|nr:Carbohydrate binding family 6 [Anaeromyxobacter sp. Fw109-5]
MRVHGFLVGAVVAVAAMSGSRAGAQQQACTAQLPATFEAEDAQLQGLEVAAEGGRGYVTAFTDESDQVAFQVCAPESGYFTFDFTYAKGTDGIALRTLQVDGRPYPGQPAFPPTWGWSAWGSGGRRAIHLDAGEHTIALAFLPTDSGELRLDNMVMSSGPTPSDVSVRSLLMNNWESLVVGWHAAVLYPKDDMGFGPRMTAFHWAKDWPTNQIDEAQAFFRDETGNTSYTDTREFDTTAYFTASDGEGFGEMRVAYGGYAKRAVPMSVTRRMIVPPGESFALVLYELGNVTDASRQLSILEWADLHNKNSGPSEDPVNIRGASPGGGGGTLNAIWDSQRNAWIADMSQTNGTFVVIGSFGPVDRHVAGAPVTGGPDSGAETVRRFATGPSALGDSDSFSGQDVGIGMSRTVTLEPARTEQIAFFYGIADSLDGARALADDIRRPGAPEVWIDQSSAQWKGWLSSGRAASLDTPVRQWAEALRIGLVTNRQSQQPEFGSFVAATNPAYNYSVWVRDSSVVAMGFDVAGHLDEAEKYWTWMAQAQQTEGSNPNVPPGTWWTNYSFFAHKLEIPFVEPELDANGLFLVGTYRHHAALKPVDAGRAARFLETVWPAVQRAADFVQREIGKAENHGFGAPDFSIWEEELQYWTFTQATYAAGLRAAQLLAEERQDSSKAENWGRARDTVRDAISRDTSTSPCPGLWHATLNYFVRAVRPDCTLDQRLDGATDLLWVFGVLDATHPRTAQHREAVLANLTPGEFGFGISRYEGDEFYHASQFSPGGQNEANGSMPVWPQMSMYMAMLEHWLGMDDLSRNRLSWYVATTHVGYQPQGEAVDWTTERPLVSTSSEPVTATWYLLALFNQLGLFDPRLP